MWLLHKGEPFKSYFAFFSSRGYPPSMLHTKLHDFLWRIPPFPVGFIWKSNIWKKFCIEVRDSSVNRNLVGNSNLECLNARLKRWGSESACKISFIILNNCFKLVDCMVYLLITSPIIQDCLNIFSSMENLCWGESGMILLIQTSEISSD